MGENNITLILGDGGELLCRENSRRGCGLKRSFEEIRA